MQPDFDRFFRNYAEAYNRSLGERVDHDAIRSKFAGCFIAAGPAGVACGNNDDSFRTALDGGYAFYKSIGTRNMSVQRVEVTPIDELHHMAKVHYRADYQKKNGEAVSIDFDVTFTSCRPATALRGSSRLSPAMRWALIVSMGWSIDAPMKAAMRASLWSIIPD